MPPQLLAAAATLLSFVHQGNKVELRLDRGSAEIVWLSPSSFHYRRVLDGPLRPAAEGGPYEAVPLQISDTASEVHVVSHHLDVAIGKNGVILRVRRQEGTALMTDLSEARSEAGGVVWERQIPAGADYFGLGPRLDTSLSLLGKSLPAAVPFLVCTCGYGEYHPGGGTYHFDFTAPDRYRISGPEIDYYFYYGPTPKEVFEEHNLQPNRSEPWTVSSDRFGSWASLKASLQKLVTGAMSSATSPHFDLAAYNTAPPELQSRARQLGSLVARITPGTVGLSGFRKQLETFYGSYIAELQDRGFPVFHPLPFQIPEDSEGIRHTDEFLLGDEMLIAPVVDPGNKRSVYLPRGIWTNLETNEVTPGPKTITVDTASLPVFARNGAIVPLDAPNGMALHYFPKLGGEFFLLEPDIPDYSQVHAAPALDIIRLEIESKKDRDYQWVVHHADKPAGVEFGERKYAEAPRLDALSAGSWFYDPATKNLHVRAKVKAGEDCIINLVY